MSKYKPDIKFDTDIELIEHLCKELPGVTRVKILNDIVSVEYGHNQWRDEFTTVDQIVKALRDAHHKAMKCK